MDNNSLRKFNSIFRKNLKDKITKLNNKSDYMFIYKLISQELETKISVNRNGVYFNLNLLGDDTIEKLVSFIDDKSDTEIITEQSKIKYECYSKENNVNIDFFYGSKFSNQEKSILKKFHQT